MTGVIAKMAFDAGKPILKEVVIPYMQEKLKEKLSPNTLLSKGEEYGLCGDKKEIHDILEKTKNGIVREKIDTEAEKEKIKEKTTYSDNTNEAITTEEELEVYQKEGLEESTVNDKTVLKDNSIDPNQIDANGRTNLERMKEGLAPLDENGRPYNLHHIGQKSDSPLAELKEGVHRKNDAVLHDKTNPSEIDRKEFAKEKAEHWKARASEMENN